MDDRRSGHAAPVDAAEAQTFLGNAGGLLGDRLLESRWDRDGALRIIVIAVTDEDRERLSGFAERAGIGGRVRIEIAQPDALSTWERLRNDLLRHLWLTPGLVTSVPRLTPGYQHPPVKIHLRCTAENLAADLHDRYGEFVTLTVGALPYPPEPGFVFSTGPPVDRTVATDISSALETDLAIRSGDDGTTGLLITNRSSRTITVNTGGGIRADVVDENNEIVGGAIGPVTLPLVQYRVKPAATVRISMNTGTNSFRTDVGYVLPPGTWRLVAPLDLTDGRRLLTPPLPFTVTSRAVV